MEVAGYLRLLRDREEQLSEAFGALVMSHSDEPDIHATGQLLAGWSRQHARALGALGERYPGHDDPAAGNAPRALFNGPRRGSRGLLYDLHDLWLLSQDIHLRWTVLGQVARALGDTELAAVCTDLARESDRQVTWLHDRIVSTAPQALVVV